MIELEREYQEKMDLLMNLKSLFYQDKKSFKKYLHEQSIVQQAKLLAFLQCNDSQFYKEVEEFTGGVRFKEVEV